VTAGATLIQTETPRIGDSKDAEQLQNMPLKRIVSKSGSNELHGSLFDYYSTPWFRARNPFAAERPPGVRHNPGGSSAFAPPQPGRFGTSSKGVIKGPGSTVFHAGLAKRIDLGGRAALRLELSGTNLFNPPNYANPALNIANAATVGVISNVGVDSDLDQAGARSFRRRRAPGVVAPARARYRLPSRAQAPITANPSARAAVACARSCVANVIACPRRSWKSRALAM
jgi:hypothetical protein